MPLKKKVLKGVKWAAAANIVQQIVSLIGLIVFAKLLSPHDFGTFSILMIFIGFLAIFSDMGTSAALIHIQEPSQNLLSSIFFLNILIGVALTVLLGLSAPSIAHYFHNPDLKLLLQIVSVNFAVLSLGIVQKSLFEKEMAFKTLSLLNSIAILLGLLSGLIAAFMGWGVYSLVIQLMVNSVLSIAMIWYLSSWKPHWYFSWDEIKKIWSYTSNLSIFTIINYFSKNADNFLIGKYLSSSALGVYSLAYRIMLYPLQNISITLMKVLFPAFSTLQNDNKKFKKIYLQVIFALALITFPIMTGLMATAQPLVDVVFGDKWQGLGMLLIILAPSGLLRSIYSTVGALFMAKGNTRTQLKLGTANAILTVIGFIIGLQWGINGVALSYLIVNLIMLYPTFKISWKQIELDVTEGLSVLLPLLLIASFMGIATYALGEAIAPTIDNKPIQLIVTILFGITIYAGMLRLKYGHLKKLVKSLRG